MRLAEHGKGDTYKSHESQPVVCCPSSDFNSTVAGGLHDARVAARPSPGADGVYLLLRGPRACKSVGRGVPGR